MIIDVVRYKSDGQRTVLQLQIDDKTGPNGEYEGSRREKYDTIVDYNCAITYEVLRTDEISVAIEEPTYGDYRALIEQVGTIPTKALERLIDSFVEDEFIEWRQEKEREEEEEEEDWREQEDDEE